MTDHQGTEGTPALAASNRQRMPVFALGKVTLLLLALFAGASLTVATAQSTAETLGADTAACRQSNDNVACERAYDYLTAEMQAVEEALASKDRKKKKAAKGKSPETFHPELRALAETGCTAGNAWLCTELGWAYRKATLGLAEDKPLEIKYYTQACELGNGYGCAVLGLAHELGQTMPVDRKEAERLYKKGCEMESKSACMYQADLLLVDLVNAAPAPAASITVLQDRCRDTALDGPSCAALGIAYWKGDLVSKDQDLSRQYWSKGCDRAVYAPACYLNSLRILRSEDMAGVKSGGLFPGLRALVKACDFNVQAACEFAIFAGQEFAWDNAWVVLKGRYNRCLYKPTREDCEFAGDTYKLAKVLGSDGELQDIEYDPGRIARAWLTACRNFNTRCVEVADEHLKGPTLSFAIEAPNLAIGILETACERGDAASCARKEEVIAETGGVQGSYIDPMISDDERFMLARFDLQRGDTQRGRETMQWLATMGYTSAQIELANAYRGGLASKPLNPDGTRPNTVLFDASDMTWALYEILAKKGIPEAAMLVAVRKYQGHDDNFDGVRYEEAIYRALYLGAEGAAELDAAEKVEDKARTDARIANIQAMHRQNIESRDNMDRQTVQSAWDQYYKRQEERKEAAGGEVCGTVYGEGNSTYRTCMSRDTAMKYYRGNF
ncbi:tetratricopeptide repeat protein [Hyphomonas sp. BRH_c22]|uniref:tetratricopeptide repeat protein n=1 Tax=Hyphomonas sp. BRH_c22 TaxID=1629710 RepID=UPI000A7EFE2B|nr:tetratricopeptide repeat protein [Hyphomonas sp. BRH_c22]